MDEILVGWLFLLAMLLYRFLTSFRLPQRALHCLWPLTPLLQWYTLTFLGLALLTARTFYDICLYDYFAYRFLTSERVEQNLHDIMEDNKGFTQADLDALRIPLGLKVFSLLSPLFGVLGMVLVLGHVTSILRKSHEVKAQSADPDHAHKWWVPERLSMVLIVVGMPMVFIAMSMRATIRIWAVMTGSAWVPFHRNPVEGATWEGVKTLELATYSMDLELAVTFQFYMVSCFGQICGSYLADSKYLDHSGMSPEVAKQYSRTLKYAAIQGLYAFVVVGVLRSALDFGITVMQEDPLHKEMSDQIQLKVLSKIGPVFAFATILCVVNMLIIGKMKDITDHLGNANMKFQGTRLLLLIAQIQPQILSGITTGSKLYEAVQQNAEKFHLEGYLERWTFTDYQSKLMHVSLLSLECLVVILFNRVFWKLDDGQMSSLLERPRRIGEEAGGGYRRLP